MQKNWRVEFKFGHVHIKCHDLDSTKKFYEEMFNANLLFEEEVRNARIAMMEIGGTYIHLSEAGPEEDLEPSKQPRGKVWIRYGIGHFGFRVKDLDEAVRELKTRGAEFIQEPRDIREGVRVAFIRGPEDDVIEISERSESFEKMLLRKP